MKLFKKLAVRVAVLASLAAAGGSASAQGIPVYDNLGFVNSLQQVISWGNQAQQMISQIQHLQQQFQQLQQMTNVLDGARQLGSILNDPSIASVLPPEIQDSNRMLQAGFSTGQLADIQNFMNTFGVRNSMNGNPLTTGQGAANSLAKIQAMLKSAQSRAQQARQLASRVDSSSDTKSSLDLANRNIIETATATNQLTQTVATIEAERKSDELRTLAEDQSDMESILTRIRARRH